MQYRRQRQMCIIGREKRRAPRAKSYILSSASYTHFRAHETRDDLLCSLPPEKKEIGTALNYASICLSLQLRLLVNTGPRQSSSIVTAFFNSAISIY